MKTKSLTAMLMAMALSFNFAACSDEDENGGGGSGLEGASKRLTQMYVQNINGDGNNEFDLQYDNEGRVTQISSTWEDFNATYTYSYSGNEVTIHCSFLDESETGYDTDPDYSTITYTLNDKGYATSGSGQLSGSRMNYIFTYTDDYLVEVTEQYDNWTPHVDESNRILSDGLILPYDWNMVEYTDIPNKGNFFIHYANEVDIFDCFEYYELYWANLGGKAPKYLPAKVAYSDDDFWTFSYDLDNEGYVTTISITDEEGLNFTTITCTYEPIP